uniref:Uncharacterized protein n=1 Tax=Nothobranchius furzeri TaxID=105023 RepID=A0A8C6LRT1_NOTFU
MRNNISNSTDSPATETPIEREIRRAIQREQSLRRSRGLPNPHTAPEYVEIPSRKGILSQSLTSKWSQNKDREFAGKMMQQEIHEETRREQDLVKIGKIPGFYDKGTVRQIKERKQLFEAFQTSLESTKSKMSSFKSTEDLTLEGGRNHLVCHINNKNCRIEIPGWAPPPQRNRKFIKTKFYGRFELAFQKVNILLLLYSLCINKT